jgi:capsular polysaccharide biosynthesis protein
MPSGTVGADRAGRGPASPAGAPVTATSTPAAAKDGPAVAAATTSSMGGSPASTDAGTSTSAGMPAAPDSAAGVPPLPLSPAQELVRLAEQQRWHDVRPHLAAMAMVVQAVAPTPGGKVAVVGGDDVEPWAAILSERWPDLRVTTVRVTDDESEAHVRLTVEAPFDAVVDASDTTGNDQALLFQRVFMHLRQGGSFVARRLVPHPAPPPRTTGPTQGPERRAPAFPRDERLAYDDALPNENLPPEPPYDGDLWGLVSAAQTARTRDFHDHLDVGPAYRDIEGLGSCLAEVHVHSKVLRVVNGLRVAPKLREEEADAVLAARPELGECLEVLPAVTWSSDIAYDFNRLRDPYVQTVFPTPPMALRRYDRPVCSRGQIVTKDGLLFPETFRQSWMERLANIYVVEKAPRFGMVRRDISKPDELPGAWFHLDSEWPGHFGHLLTEQLSRLWAWDRVREVEPDVRILMTLTHDREPMVLAPFEIEILGAFGVEPDDIQVFTSPCRPERLYTATGMFSLPRFVHPQMADIWDRVGDHVVRSAPEGDRPGRIFASRRPTLKRACHNTPEVEELFAAHGFAVIHPEDHSLGEQVAMFRAAETVAGFAGSGLFSLAFCPTPKRVISLGPDTYTARNEYLISAVRGHSLTSVFSRPDVGHPEGSWTQKAFASGFTFDLEDEGRFVAERLARLDG